MTAMQAVGAITDITVARSISSTVLLDRVAGTAHKTYAPPAWVRVLYRLAFQAPFPSAKNADALEAARLRREIAGKLMHYWSGTDLVAPVVEVPRHMNGRMGFVTQLVPGGAPVDKRHARKFLRTVTERFLDAGLPTWQVTPYNPRAIGNLIASPDGTYRVIDLESNLVAPLMPLSGIVGAIRQGNFPSFDDIDMERLDRYLVREEKAIIGSLGIAGYGELLAGAAMYRQCVQSWRRDEPRVISKALRLALKLVDVPSWISGIRRMTSNSRTVSERVIAQGIDSWTAEGYITDERAATLRVDAQAPEVASALAHMGAHVAMTVPLRFPLGSIARAGWTVVMRLQAECKALLRRGSASAARQEHTLLVAFASLVPTFGAAAYMLSKPLRTNRSLAVIALDRMMRKMPFRSYERTHMAPFMVYHARLDGNSESHRPTLKQIASGVRQRSALLRGYVLPLAVILAVNAVIVGVGGYLYFAEGTRVIFDERGVMNTADALQLVFAGVFAIAAWRAFWARDIRARGSSAPLEEAAGIMFWGIAGFGLMYLAADDYFTLHERMGAWLDTHLTMVPLFTNSTDDVITLATGATGLIAVWIFRAELLALRPSSALLCAGVAAAGLMTFTDVYGHGFIRPLEFPAQMSACGLLLLANIARYVEVRQPAQAREPQRGRLVAEPVAA
jgi:hypothetical protein